METKVNTFPEIKQAAKGGSLKFACLQSLNGQRLVAYNSPSLKPPLNVEQQIDKIEKWVKSTLCAPGAYYVVVSASMRKSTEPSKFLINKQSDTNSGASNGSTIFIREKEEKGLSEVEEKLSLSHSLSLIAENAELKAEVRLLEAKIVDLQSQINLMDEEEEEEETGVGESITKPLTGFLSENKEIITSLFDRYISAKEKANDINEAKLQKPNATPKTIYVKDSDNNNASGAEVMGSDAHMKRIHQLYETDDNAFNDELDIIEKANPDLYKRLILHYQLEEEGGGKVFSSPEAMKQEILRAKTLKEVFVIAERYGKIEDCKLSDTMTKILVENIPKLFILTNTKNR